MGTQFRLALFVLVIALLGYQLMPHVPDELEEKWKYRAMMAFMNGIGIYGQYMHSSAGGDDPSVRTIEGVKAAFRWTSEDAVMDHLGPGVTRLEGTFNGTKVYIYQPPAMSTEGLVPGFIYFHGGGLALGSAKLYDGMARKISSRLNAVVINVDYDTTPKNKFPGPLNQCYAATKWLLLHARDYGVDFRRVAVGGDSAGGYLSAAVSQLIYDDEMVPNLKLQVLIYPWTQCFDFYFPSYQEYTKTFEIGKGFVCRESMVMYCTLHAWGTARPDLVQMLMENRHIGPSFKKSTLYQETLGHDLLPAAYRVSSSYQGPTPSDQGDEEFWQKIKTIFLDPRFTPHFRHNMTGLPTAYVVTAGFDSLRDEGNIYAQQLKKAGVDVTLVHYEKAWHGSHWSAPYFIFAIGEQIHDDFLEFAKERL
ncbi:arylacetamide deacetylase-like [Apostichopus japonicus]|uniref:arylacetamide deacetylase-like n=1 Tax=Stichopus japonicus TaxID=307972 RepID=UPI003AB689AD